MQCTGTWERTLTPVVLTAQVTDLGHIHRGHDPEQNTGRTPLRNIPQVQLNYLESIFVWFFSSMSRQSEDAIEEQFHFNFNRKNAIKTILRGLHRVDITTNAKNGIVQTRRK